MGSFVIAIDGPAGSGKSTVSGKLARKLGFNFLTTGAFYRGLAILCQLKKVKMENHGEVVALATYPGFVVKADMNGTQVFIDGKDVTAQLSSEQTAKVASQVSAIAQVREALLPPQRAFKRPPGLVAEGRDCGTVVFPEAQVKVFLTASLDTRAQRRFSEDKSATSSHEQRQNLAHRDEADSGRKVAPMAKADDAVLIDTSSLTVDEVVDQIEKLVKRRLGKT